MSKDPYTYKNDLQKRPASKEPCIIQRKPTKETHINDTRSMCGTWSMTDMSKKPYMYGNIGLFCRIQSLLQGSFAQETSVFGEPTHCSHWSTLKSGSGAQFSCQERKYQWVLTIIHVLHSRHGYTARDVFVKTFKRDSCTHQTRPTNETHWWNLNLFVIPGAQQTCQKRCTHITKDVPRDLPSIYFSEKIAADQRVCACVRAHTSTETLPNETYSVA